MIKSALSVGALLAGALLLLLVFIGAARLILPKEKADEVGFWCWAVLCVGALVLSGSSVGPVAVFRRP